ncbi:hypothetical protein [Rhizobium sp. FY34]|uniref:hypothetical protein n=1 Tax=Rhizobium sp. FY34 TaxID=2562309 RepID=UPI0010C0830B|nr:hypothetical protein [Rhizobium sp. FY34]
MANATATKGRRRRRRASAKASSATWPWVLALVGTAGAILAYENSDLLRRWLSGSGSVAAIQQRLATSAKPQKPPEPVAAPAHPLQKPSIPALTPPLPLAKVGEEGLIGKGYSGTFYFCGTSGLDNCVSGGDLFWFKKQAIRIADIAAPATEDARCPTEREKGFAAKVRLRDLLNAGSFELVDWPNQNEDGRGRKLRVVMRNGQSLGSQMAGEGLVHAAGKPARPWC